MTIMAVARAAADLFLGVQCVGCERPGYVLCESCRRLISPELSVYADLGGTLPVAVAGSYLDPLAALVVAYKDHGAWHLRNILGALLVEATTALAPDRGTVLVPVPSSVASVRRRGWDHVAQLSTYVARELGCGSRRLLSKCRRTPDQSTLSRRQRQQAQRGSMRAIASGDVKPGARVIIVDDIITTGATMREATRVLRMAGYEVAGVAAICQTPSSSN